MVAEATERAQMPEGTSVVLDSRTVEKDYPTLIPLLKKGMRVLDVGCGTGAITKGIAEMVGKEGFVLGIDSSEHLIAKGKEDLKEVTNLELKAVDLFAFVAEEKFDLVVSARVMQWLSNPKEALLKCKEFLKSGGQISVVDYNHKNIEWKPQPPESMKRFYQAFLDWREDAGIDNEIAEHLPEYFHELDFHSVDVLRSNEIYRKEDRDFVERARIWSHVAALRGKQIVQSGYISEDERLQAIAEYNTWVENEAVSMTMSLKDVRAKI